MDRVSKRPWFRKSRNALYHCAAFIVGSTYEDERVAFTAPKLVKNDAYRDRLLVPEIEDLVTLCDALRLTLPQRKAYFQCFLHLDFMRRSSISRAELLRYCTLRATPLTSFLLPNAEEATHRDAARNRWDIMQLMAACFSFCTADIVELVQLAVAEATRPPEATADESDDEGSIQGHDDNEDVVVQADKKTVDDKQATHGNPPGICQQIDQCLAFFRLVKTHGYHFAQTLLAKSNVKELNHASKTPLDERRSKQRYAKAWRGSTLVEDKMIYWKEFEDPVANRLFYYNVRTGESRWEKPPNFVGKKKARRRRKLKDQEELQKIPA
ncbi:hypothetical protein PR002_g10044 [Phytophthora rubi]|uniref:WW domain-containing protein n=1 Tax=Phytophthora rubi TaxID=129364 RepID=A0A6A3MM45_9STRA|nr:hypothetical protein PR002_g10044 [Phytophthora rubi]